MRILGWLSVFMCAVLVVSSLSAYTAYRKLAGNISHEEVALGKRPDDTSEAVNILLLGSDTRSAAGTQKYGEVSGARSDTVILMHLPPGHDRATLISFPRDSLVDIPSCKQPNGTMSEPLETRLNAAFTIGGPACTWKTIESLTGIRIDHFVMVNFAGFKQTVNALGGVRVCLPEPVQDPRSGLDLAAGPQVVRGEQALAFVRVRHGIGNGSDLERIRRQQEFLAGMVKRATSMGLLLNPGKLFGFLDAATKTLTTDSGFELGDLQRLALSAKGIKPSDVTFVTVPVVPSGDGATVEWQEPQASQLFDAIKHAKKIPEKSGSKGSRSPGQGGSSPSSGGTGSPVDAKPTVPPPGIQVAVLNGTGISGLAAETATKLEDAGFEVTKVGNADAQSYSQSVVRHDPELQASANILAGAVGAGGTESDEALGTSVVLILGEDAQGLKVNRGPSSGQGGAGGSASSTTRVRNDGSSSPVPEGVDSINAAKNPCQTSSVQ